MIDKLIQCLKLMMFFMRCQSLKWLFIINLCVPSVWAALDDVQIEQMLSSAFSKEHQSPAQAVDILENLIASIHPQVHGKQYLQAHLLLASSYMWLGEAELAKTKVEMIINHPLLSDQQRAEALIIKAKALAWVVRLDEAISLFEQAIDIAKAGKFSVPLLRAEAYLGVLFAYKGNFDEAILNLNTAFSLMETQGRVLWLWSEIFGIASRIFYLMNDQEKAMEYARKANRFLLEMESPLRLSHNLVDQGRILAKQGREEIALEFFEAASVWVEGSRAPVRKAYVLLRKSEHLLVLNEIKKADRGLVEVMIFGDQKQDTYLQIYSRLIMVDARLARGDLDEIELILQQAEQAVVDRPDIMEVYFSRFYLLRSRFYNEAGRYKEAYVEFQRYWRLREKALSRQYSKPIGKAKSQISELSEKENRLLVREVALKSDEVEKEQKQKMILGSLIAILLSVLSFVGYLLHKNIKLRRWLHELSSTDDLTKVANRRYIMETMEFEVGRAHRYVTPLCAALLDIDHFKSINDTYGHHIGDEVLKRLAKLYNDNMREMDVVGRYGGEEFVLVLPHTHISAAKQVLERLREMTEAQVFDSMLDRQVTVSIGLAELSDSETVDDLLKRADEVLYEAKRGGRNRIVMSLSARQMAKVSH